MHMTLTEQAHAQALRRELLHTLRQRAALPVGDRRGRDALRRRVAEIADEIRRLKEGS